MDQALTIPKALVLSDNDGLSRAIAINLRKHFTMEIVQIAPDTSAPPDDAASDVKLIVVALSSPNSEPVVMLSRNALTGYIGQVPTLIISDRPFKAAPRDRIFYLNFPFDIDQLANKVKEILKIQMQPAQTPQSDTMTWLNKRKRNYVQSTIQH
jgi:hypothetical protein